MNNGPEATSAAAAREQITRHIYLTELKRLIRLGLYCACWQGAFSRPRKNRRGTPTLAALGGGGGGRLRVPGHNSASPPAENNPQGRGALLRPAALLGIYFVCVTAARPLLCTRPAFPGREPVPHEPQHGHPFIGDSMPRTDCEHYCSFDRLMQDGPSLHVPM